MNPVCIAMHIGVQGWQVADCGNDLVTSTFGLLTSININSGICAHYL